MQKIRKRNRHDLVNQTTAAKIVGCTRQNIPNLIARGLLDAVCVGGMVFVERASAERLAQQRAEHTRAA